MKLDHIAINSEDIKKSIQWYQKTLQTEVIYCDDTWALLDCNGLRIALISKSQHPPHFAITVPSLDHFPEPDKIKYHRDGSAYLYVQDPDGNTIEYICWNTN